MNDVEQTLNAASFELFENVACLCRIAHRRAGEPRVEGAQINDGSAGNIFMGQPACERRRDRGRSGRRMRR